MLAHFFKLSFAFPDIRSKYNLRIVIFLGEI